MRSIILIAFLTGLLGFSGISDAQIRKPMVTPLKEQDEQQMMRDYAECHDIAVRETGVHPDGLRMQMQQQQATYARAARPGPRGGLTPWVGEDTRAEESRQKVKELEKKNEEYIRAFSRAMEERGYRVK